MAPIFPEAEAIPIYIGIDRMGMADAHTHGGGGIRDASQVGRVPGKLPCPGRGAARSEKMTYTTIEE